MESDPHLSSWNPLLPPRFCNQNDSILNQFGKVESFHVQSLGLALDMNTWSATITTKRVKGRTVEAVVGWPQPKDILIVAHH